MFHEDNHKFNFYASAFLIIVFLILFITSMFSIKHIVLYHDRISFIYFNFKFLLSKKTKTYYFNDIIELYFLIPEPFLLDEQIIKIYFIKNLKKQKKLFWWNTAVSRKSLKELIDVIKTIENRTFKLTIK